MLSKVIVAFLLAVFAQDTTYYVTSDGRDSSSCGTEETPCASINQVINNHPSDSFTVSIAAGVYKTDLIQLQGNAFVVFQGTGNTTIVGNWGESYSFINNSDSSSYEFHDLTLSLFGDGDGDFSRLNTNANFIGFYNVFLTYASSQYKYVYSDFIHMFAGSLVMSNLTFSQAILDSNFIMDYGSNGDSNITITGSNFINNTFLRGGGLFQFYGYGTANILFDTTTFDGNSAQDVFILYIAEDSDQIIIMSNNIFNNTHTSAPSVSIGNAYYVTHDRELAIIQNTTWINATADYDSGAIEIIGSDSLDQYDCKITLNNLTFVNCVGKWAGALLVYCNSLTLSNSTFSNNSVGGGGYGTDVVQVLNDNTAEFGYSITSSYSSSALPKAAIWNDDSDTVTDISGELPNKSRYSAFVRNLRRKFGRKVRKN